MARFLVTASELNVRPRPDKENTPLGTIAQGTEVEKLDESGDWYLVRIAVKSNTFTGNVEGWVSSKYLESASLTEETDTSESDAYASSLPEKPFSIDSDLKERPSPLDAELIDDYFRGKGSHLEGIGAAVMAASNKYKINATYIISHAIHETGWGKSRIYREKNNLFGYGAIDSSPYGDADKFPSREECIDFVMGKVNENYLTPGGKFFKSNPCLGDKTHGMNVHYANDEGWGQKIAAIARGVEKWVGALSRDLRHAEKETGKGESKGSGKDYSPSAQRILAAVDRVNPEQQYYQPHDIAGDPKPETFCNWFVADVLDILGLQLPRYDASAGYYPIPHPIYGKKKKEKPKLATELNQYFKKGGGGKWREVSRAEAIEEANQGRVVVASIPGHIGLVIPGGKAREVRIAQAGRICGKNMKLEEGFGHAQVGFFGYTC